MTNDGAPTRTRLTRDERRDQLTRIARDLFVQHGRAGVRTRQIAEQAGVSEAVLYHHFTSKEELYEAAVLGRLEELVADLAVSAPELAGTEGAARHETGHRIASEIVASMRDLVPLLGVALFSDHDSGTTLYRASVQPLLEKVQDSVRTAVAGWGQHNIDPEMITAVLLGTCHWLAMQEQFGNGPTPTRIPDALADLLVRALTPRPDQLTG